MLWLRSQLIDYLVLDYALAVEDAHGRPTLWASLGNHLRTANVNISDLELIETLKGLRQESRLRLIKWYDGLSFQDYSEYDEHRGFFNGEFRLLVTREGRKYHGEAQTHLLVATPANNRNIGFHA